MNTIFFKHSFHLVQRSIPNLSNSLARHTHLFTNILRVYIPPLFQKIRGVKTFLKLFLHGSPMKIIGEKEAEDFLQKNGFRVTKRAFATTKADVLRAVRQLKLPVTLKISSKKILHKSDVGGVKIDLRTPKEVIVAFNQLKRIRGFEGVLVQKHLTGHSLILGLKKDPTFGHAVMIGSGGIYTEILKDVSFRVCPLTSQDATSMIQELKAYPILKGSRGKKPAHLNSVKDHILKISKLAAKHENIEELDINPLMVNDKGSYVVDARLILN
jgi:acyl-CoA synthetase (NDP forming)